MEERKNIEVKREEKPIIVLSALPSSNMLRISLSFSDSYGS